MHMSVNYSTKDMVTSEVLKDHINLETWLIKILESHHNRNPHIWQILKQEGQYFYNPLKEYPKNIKTPDYVERGRCHHNNLIFAQILFDNHRDIIDDFRFVTGLWLRKAKNINPLSDTNYWVGPHSFLTYKENILDCGALTNPPISYEILQYFGISFEIEHVLKLYKNLEAQGLNPEEVPIIKVLTQIPCLI
jgi:hypothetical protein